jgi:hypothetical protein
MKDHANQATREPDTGRPTRQAAPAPVAPPISSTGMLIGTVILGVLLLLFALWANHAGQRAGAEARGAPGLVLLEPRDGEVVTGPIGLVFETAAELRRGPAGWESGGFHVHAEVDGLEVMPGADDIIRLGDGRFRWVLRPLPPGARELRLFWSDQRHQEVEGSGSPVIRVEAR